MLYTDGARDADDDDDDVGENGVFVDGMVDGTGPRNASRRPKIINLAPSRPEDRYQSTVGKDFVARARGRPARKVRFSRPDGRRHGASRPLTRTPRINGLIGRRFSAAVSSGFVGLFRTSASPVKRKTTPRGLFNRVRLAAKTLSRRPVSIRVYNNKCTTCAVERSRVHYSAGRTTRRTRSRFTGPSRIIYTRAD